MTETLRQIEAAEAYASRNRIAELEAENARLQAENERLRSLFGENGKGYITVRDLCFNAFMRAKDTNDEDGGPADWFNDTVPKVEKGIERMLRYATQSSPVPGK